MVESAANQLEDKEGPQCLLNNQKILASDLDRVIEEAVLYHL